MPPPKLRIAQYQHFVPRFILRYFATDEDYVEKRRLLIPGSSVDVNEEPRTKVDRVNVYDLTKRSLTFRSDTDTVATSIAKNYGIMDMYVDLGHADIDHIEKKLSVLEGTASTIISNIAKSLPTGHVTFSRKDLNTLRKFLWVLSYRNDVRYQQFFEEKFDQDTFLVAKEFMRRQGLKSLKSIWLQTLDQVLDTPVWEIPGNEKIYFPDRVEYVSCMREYGLCFWEAPEVMEFIICNNGFGFFEGSPSTVKVPPELKAQLPQIPGFDSRSIPDIIHHHIEWLRLYPLTPRILLVFARNILRCAPNPVLEMVLNNFTQGIPSSFQQFPFLLPTISYDGRNEGLPKYEAVHRPSQPWLSHALLDGKILESREQDTFSFPFAKLSTSQLLHINTLFLHGASEKITFRSPLSLYESIKAYEITRMWPGPLKNYDDLKQKLKAELNQRP